MLAAAYRKAKVKKKLIEIMSHREYIRHEEIEYAKAFPGGDSHLPCMNT